MPTDGRTPLLSRGSESWWDFAGTYEDVDFHEQFCRLVGIPPSDAPDVEQQYKHIAPRSLYGRVLNQRSSQNRTYAFTAGISNTLLLAQIVIGAAVTALGASESSHILIAIFGAANTIIAGVVAYLKSRGQPMRARMFRDDLERVVDEIENSEVLFLGLTKKYHGYQDIDIDKTVSVRSEVARLTRLYEEAVRSNTQNNPDIYLANSGDPTTPTALRPRPQGGRPLLGQHQSTPAAAARPGNGKVSAPAPDDVDDSPATAPPKPAPVGDQKRVDDPNKSPSGEVSKAAPQGDTENPAEDGAKDRSKTGTEPAPPSATAPTPAPTPFIIEDDDDEPATRS